MERSQREMPGGTPREAARAPRHRRPRLSKSADFDRVYRRGRSVSSRHLVLYAFPWGSDGDSQRGGEVEEAAPDLRLGVSVGRKVGGAVDRNRVKRSIREAFWSLLEDLPRSHDYVVVARPGSAAFVEAEGLEALRGDLSELVSRLGESSPAGPAGPAS